LPFLIYPKKNPTSLKAMKGKEKRPKGRLQKKQYFFLPGRSLGGLRLRRKLSGSTNVHHTYGLWI